MVEDFFAGELFFALEDFLAVLEDFLEGAFFEADLAEEFFFVLEDFFAGAFFEEDLVEDFLAEELFLALEDDFFEAVFLVLEDDFLRALMSNLESCSASLFSSDSAFFTLAFCDVTSFFAEVTFLVTLASSCFTRDSVFFFCSSALLTARSFTSSFLL